MSKTDYRSAAKVFSAFVLIALMTWLVPLRVLNQNRLRDAPPVMLWAWERPENLSAFSDSKNIGTAFLAATISLSGKRIYVHRRQQPLICEPGRYVMPVIRIETDRKNPPKLSSDQVDAVVARIYQVASGPNWHGVQIDFDATKNQRQAYKMLLAKLRSALPSETPISITAIASWCAGDYWLANLPVDEVVPMYFDMGVGESSRGQYLETISDHNNSGKNPNCKCHSAIGISTSEMIPLKKSQYTHKRVYLFSRHPWQTSSEEERIEITKILKYTEAS